MKSSNVATELFNKEQHTDNPYKLVQEVPTRWNSAFHMIKRILETSDALNRTLLKINKAPQPLAAEEIMILKEVVDILACFDEATIKISGSKYVTISLIIPIIQGIYRTLSTKRPQLETDEGKEICTRLLDSIQKRFFPYEKRTAAQMGTLLDPRFKQDGFRSDENIKSASHFLEQEMNYMEKKEAETTSNSSMVLQDIDSPGTSSSFLGSGSSSSSLFSFMEEKMQQKIKSTTVDVIIMKRQYMERQNTTTDTDPLLFWKVRVLLL